MSLIRNVTSTALLMAMPLSRTRSRTLFASLPDGGAGGGSVEIHYELGGRGSHPVLLLPGALGSSRTDFEPQLRLLGDDEHLGVMDLLVRRVGLSRRISSPGTPTTPSPS